MQDYNEFLAEKQIIHKSSGFTVEEKDLNPVLFGFQNALVRYALRKGKSAILADTGLGKTLLLAEWAKQIQNKENGPVLIVAPLFVAYQSIDMIKNLFGYDIVFANEQADIKNGIYITNYEKLKHFTGKDLVGIAWDESSIFKGIDSRTFEIAKKITKNIPYRLCCSATPAPNSIEEMGRQAEILGIMTVAEMKANFFINRAAKKGQRNVGQSGWELRPHGREKFYKWLASWAMAIKLPSDIGFSDEGYILPELTIEPIFVESGYVPDGQLFFTGLKGVSDRGRVRKNTLEERAHIAAEIIKDDPDQWIIWTGLNPEADLMHKLLGNSSVNVQGSDDIETKVANLRAFTQGKIKYLISKTKIAGKGANFQDCHKMMFVGLNDSFEDFYQAIKRIHRFRQEFPCNIKIILSEQEREIWDNVNGRATAVHVMDLPSTKSTHGFTGKRDFSGDVIRLYQKCGWEYQGRIPIGKNPQATAIRTKTQTLTFAQFGRDSIKSMPVQGDYLLKFTKPGQNPIPVTPLENNGDGVVNDTWIEWAGFTWTDIRETNVLSFRDAKSEDDVKHICPLQLDVVERAIKLWSNPGEFVFDPFMGIGTTVYQAIMFNRKGVGIELKPEYYYQAQKNIKKAVAEINRGTLFEFAGIEI